MLGFLRRRPRLAADRRPALGPDERILAWADAPQEQVVVATNRGLWLPGRGRLGWHEINKAAWSGRELRVTPSATAQQHEGWVVIGPPTYIPDKHARIVTAPGGERIAVFRDGNQIGALTNVCAHQNGPLGEGCIVNGLVTCPWHRYEYRLEDGCAPPPFTEKLVTYRVRLRQGMIEVDPNALPAGTKAAIHIGAP